MLTDRQEKLLNFLVREYLETAEPVSSFDLKKTAKLDVSPATVRNDLQALTEMGYISQPHTSAGRIPTKKAYQYFAEKLEEKQKVRETQTLEVFIMQQVRHTHQEIEQEMNRMQEIMRALEKNDMFEILTILDQWHRL